MYTEREKRFIDVLGRRQSDFAVVLENVFDPHNISAIFRTCDAVGIQEVFILNTQDPPIKKWGYKSSGSANKWITTHLYDNIKKCLLDVKLKYSKIYCTTVGQGCTNLFEQDLTQNMALVFGNERDGASKEMLATSDGCITIPQVGLIKSLNISVACAVCLYEAFRQKKMAGHYNTSSYSKQYIQELFSRPLNTTI